MQVSVINNLDEVPGLEGLECALLVILVRLTKRGDLILEELARGLDPRLDQVAQLRELSRCAT